MRNYMVYYYAELNGVRRKGCILMHGCYCKIDAITQAKRVLGVNIDIVEVKRQ